MNGKIKKLLDIVRENNNLSGEEKFELSLLLDKASRNLESYDLGRIISGLKNLISDLDDPDLFTSQDYLKPRYQDILHIVLDRVTRDKRKLDFQDDPYFPAFDDYRPITFERFLGSLGDVEKTNDGKIIITPKDPGLLLRDIKVSRDDGMGYAPEGSSKVFSAYQDDDKDISIWI